MMPLALVSKFVDTVIAANTPVKLFCMRLLMASSDSIEPVVCSSVQLALFFVEPVLSSDAATSVDVSKPSKLTNCSPVSVAANSQP